MYLRPFSIGTHPENGFVSYELPKSVDEHHGIISYDRLLTVDEIFHFSLLPVWDNVGQFVNWYFNSDLADVKKIDFIGCLICEIGKESVDIADVISGIAQEMKVRSRWYCQGVLSDFQIGKYIIDNWEILKNLK